MFVNIEAKPITFNKNLSFPTRRSKLKKIVRLSSEGAYVELTYLLAEIMESSSSSINRQMEEKRKRGKRFLTFNEGESLGFLKSTRVEDKRMRKKDFDSSVKSERNFLKIHFVHISRSSKFQKDRFEDSLFRDKENRWMEAKYPILRRILCKVSYRENLSMEEV